MGTQSANLEYVECIALRCWFTSFYLNLLSYDVMSKAVILVILCCNAKLFSIFTNTKT